MIHIFKCVCFESTDYQPFTSDCDKNVLIKKMLYGSSAACILQSN